jgi:Cys-tRNA(Pro) deacylase
LSDIENTESTEVELEPLDLPEHLPVAVKRVVEFARTLALPFKLKIMTETTHTAAQAAEALGCDIEHILKAIVFRGKSSRKPYMFLVSGSNRVNEKMMAQVVGEVLEKADPAYIEYFTGFPVGGVSPIAHDKRIPILMDETLMNYAKVWCAAGTDKAVMQVPTAVLARVVAARLVRIN